MANSSAATDRPPRTRITGRGLGLVSLSFGAVLLGTILPEPAAVQLGLFGLLLVLAAWPLAARNLSGLTVRRTAPENAFAGQLFPYTLQLEQQRRRSSFAVEVEDSISGPAERGLDAASVSSGSPAMRSFETRLLRRGMRHRARAILRSGWPLGLWRSEWELRDSLEMTIYPRPVPPRALEDAQDAAILDAEEDESIRRDWSGDFHGIRAFQPGDRLKLIHWPATARAGRLMVRQYDRRLPEKYCLVFHSIQPASASTQRNAASPQDSFESALELLCGLLQHCQERTIPYRLTASFDQWRTLDVPNPALPGPALLRLAAARRRPEQDLAPLLQALSTTEPGSRVFLISDVPVREWEDLLPALPFDVTCLSTTGMRVKRPGSFFRAPSAASIAAPNS